MADPRIRGKQAYRALKLISPDAQAFAEQISRQHAQLVLKQGGSIMSLFQALTHHEQSTRWCSEVSRGRNRLTFNDAAAALVSLYLKPALCSDVLHESFRSQVAAILGAVLKERIRNTRLYAVDDAAGRNSGQGRAFVWDNVLLPLSDLVLQSLVVMRLVPELCAGDPTLHPFGWSPNSDNLHDFLRIVLLGGLTPASVNAQFPRCRFVGFLTSNGLASTVPVVVLHCEQCRRRFLAITATSACKVCGKPLAREVRPMCLSTAFIAACSSKHSDDGRVYFDHSQAGAEGAPADIASEVGAPGAIS